MRVAWAIPLLLAGCLGAAEEPAPGAEPGLEPASSPPGPAGDEAPASGPSSSPSGNRTADAGSPAAQTDPVPPPLSFDGSVAFSSTAGGRPAIFALLMTRPFEFEGEPGWGLRVTLEWSGTAPAGFGVSVRDASDTSVGWASGADSPVVLEIAADAVPEGVLSVVVGPADPGVAANVEFSGAIEFTPGIGP